MTASRRRDGSISAVAGKRLLLVLDNLEHVLAAAPLIAKMLAAGPHLTVLSTSRARLQLRGEHEYQVAPLAVDWEVSEDARFGEPVAAVRLFAARAAEVDARFTLDSDQTSTVTEICRRVDGLPLAIELAAAQVKFLSPTALLARLEHRLPLLTGGPRDAPARQRTMRDAIAWSHELLSVDEQSIFRRLAVFEGGFTLDAAEQVTSKQTPTGMADIETAVATTVASLVDQSLLRVVDHGDAHDAVLAAGDRPRVRAPTAHPTRRNRSHTTCARRLLPGLGGASRTGADRALAASVVRAARG